METGPVKEIYLRRVGWNGVSPPTQAQLREARILQEIDQLTGRAVPTMPSVAGMPRLPAPVTLQAPAPPGRQPIPFPTLSTDTGSVEPSLSPNFKFPAAPLVPDLELEPEAPKLPFEIVPQELIPPRASSAPGPPSQLPTLLRPPPPGTPNIYDMQRRISGVTDRVLANILGISDPQAVNRTIQRGISAANEALSQLESALRFSPRLTTTDQPPSLMPTVPMETAEPAPPQRSAKEEEPPPTPTPPPPPTPEPQPTPAVLPVSRGPARTTPDIPAPNWDAVREMFKQAAPKPPETDPREKWIIGLIGAMLGAQQNPGERLGAMFARMAGAGAQAGINVRKEDRAKEDAFRKEQQQHAMNLAGLEAKIAEAEWRRLFDQWKTAEQLSIEREKLGVMRDNAGLRAALVAASLGSNISPEMLLSGVVDRAASGQLLIPGLPPDKLREEAMKLIEQRDRNAFLMLRSGAASNPTLRDVYNTAVRQVIINRLASLPDDQRMRILNAYRGIFESRPRAGQIPELSIE